MPSLHAPARRVPLDPPVEGTAAPRAAIGAARRPDLGPALLPAVVPGALLALFALRWGRGWLLLLDSAPGPRSTPWTGPDLPVGVLLRLLVGLVTAVDARAAGWAVPGLALLVAHAGALRLARRWHDARDREPAPLALLAAGCVAVANPFIVSRFEAGQIGVLWGAAIMWWLVAACVDAAEAPAASGLRPWLVAGAWAAVAAGTTVHLALIGAVPLAVAAVVADRPSGRGAAARRVAVRLGAALAVAWGVTALWLVPAIAGHRGELGEAGGERAAQVFASGGPWTTLWVRALGGAAFWRPSPADALTVVGLAVAAAWLTVPLVWRRGSGHSRRTRLALAVLAAVSAGATYVGRGPTAGAWAWAVGHLWPAGLLREPAKLVMLALPLPAAAAAVAVDRLGARSAGAARLVVAALMALTVAAWGLRVAALPPSTYPAAWAAARTVTDADDCPIVVLGDGAYVNPGFTDDRVVAHPARGFFGPRAVVSNDAGIPGIPTRSPRTPAERWAATANAPYLAAASPAVPTAPRADTAAVAGVGWVVVDRPVDRPGLVADLAAGGFDTAYRSDRIDVWRVPQPEGGCR